MFRAPAGCPAPAAGGPTAAAGGKKKQHHIDPLYSRLISIFKTNYCITWQGIKVYLQSGVLRTWNIWISYDMSPAAPRPPAARPGRPTPVHGRAAEPTAGLQRPNNHAGAPGLIIDIDNTHICGFQSCRIFSPAIFPRIFLVFCGSKSQLEHSQFLSVCQSKIKILRGW